MEPNTLNFLKGRKSCSHKKSLLKEYIFRVTLYFPPLRNFQWALLFLAYSSPFSSWSFSINTNGISWEVNKLEIPDVKKTKMKSATSITVSAKASQQKKKIQKQKLLRSIRLIELELLLMNRSFFYCFCSSSVLDEQEFCSRS